MKFKKKYTYMDRVLLSLFNQTFYPNNLVLFLILLFFGYNEFHLIAETGLVSYLIRVGVLECMVYSFVVAFQFVYTGILMTMGFFQKSNEDDITFDEDYYSVVNPFREMKYYWKDVMVCRVSNTQIFINNSNNIIQRISRSGLSDGDWADIMRFIREKTKPVALAPNTFFIGLGSIIGILGWLFLVFSIIHQRT